MHAVASPAQPEPGDTTRPRPARRRHWRRWIIGIVVVLVVLVVMTARVYIGSLAKPPLALPTAAASAPVGPLDGTWQVAAGSVAGFRIEQTVMFMSGDVVGRTNDITGSLAISGEAVTSATFDVDLVTVTSGGKPQPQFVLSLDTKGYPTATFTLTRPIALPAGFATGATATTTATGRLAMHGTTREVTVSISGRRDGSAIRVVGSVPIALADWAIEGPTGYGPLASIADHGTAEFLLVLQHE